MRISIHELRAMKADARKIAMVTAYDYPTAKLVDECGIPIILVGDSLGTVVLGYESTVPVTMDEMIHHSKAVSRGSSRSIIIGDMPFGTYHTSAEDALRNAARFLQEGGAIGVKLEGGVTVADKVIRLVDAGIPVVGHIGLTPQSVNQLGGYRVQGRTPEAANRLKADARALEDAGAFAVVLECLPSDLAGEITESLCIPTIGIGAGPMCDGQVQVISDMLGMSSYLPKHARKYVDVPQLIKEAVRSYIAQVEAGEFPER